MPPQRLCTVVPDNDVTQVVDQWVVSCPPFHEAWQALLWLLARNPLIGVPYLPSNPKARLYKQAGFERFDVPDITVVYTLDKDLVEIRAIRITNIDDDMAEIHIH